MKIRIILLFSFFSSLSFGQNETYFDFFNNNQSLNNPAYSGVNYKHFAAVDFNDYYFLRPGALYLFSSNYDFNTQKINSGFGLGFTRLQNDIGDLRNTRIYLNYSYHFKIKKSILSIGISPMYLNYAIDLSDIKFEQPISSIEPEPIIYRGYLNLTFGTYFKSNNLELELSVFNLLAPNQSLTRLESKIPLCYYLSSGYNFTLSNSLKLKTNVKILSNFNNYGGNINNTLNIKDKFFFGFAFNSNTFDEGFENIDFISLQGGIILKKMWRLGLTYSITISDLLGNFPQHLGISAAFMFNKN